MRASIAILIAVLGFVSSVAWAQGQSPVGPSAKQPATQAVQAQRAGQRPATGRAATPTPSAATSAAPVMLPLPELPRETGPALLCACLRIARHA